MARRLPLLRVVKAALPNGGGEAIDFDYGEMMRALLRHAPPGDPRTGARGGLSLDEVIRCVDAMQAVDAAIAGKAEEVKLSEEQYRTLREKLDTFAFAMADKVIAEFGMAIRNAPEIT